MVWICISWWIVFLPLSCSNRNINFWFLSSKSLLQRRKCKCMWVSVIWVGTKYWLLAVMNIYQLLLLKDTFFFLPEFLSKQFQNVTPSVIVFWKQYQPSFLSSGVIFTFVSVMSLNEARKSTTSPFSFFIGTISKRHQNGDPATVITIQINHGLLFFSLWKSNH